MGLESPIGGECALLLLFLSLLFTIVAYIVYSGLLAPVEVSALSPPFEPSVFAYKTGKGAYKNAGEIFTNSFCLSPNRRTMGIYYDDPDTVPENDLRFAVGSILAEGPEATPDHTELSKYLSDGFKLIHFPKPEFAVVATFPFRTTLSIYLAIWKVYPRLKQYIASRGLCAYPCLEIYDSNVIHFVMPLSKQEQFFVREFLEDEISIATTERSSYSTRGGVNGAGPSRVANLVEVEEEDSTAAVEEIETSAGLSNSLGQRSNVPRRSQRKTTAKLEDDDSVFVRPKEPPSARITRSSTKEKKDSTAVKGSREEVEQSASDSMSDFEDLGTEEISSSRPEAGPTSTVQGKE